MKNLFRVFAFLLIAAFFSTQSFSGTIASHRVRQARPVKMGTSGGNVLDSTLEFCCSGTLGAVVTDLSGIQYVLSNNHVLAKANRATIGDPISQPGLIDARCNPATEAVANLSRFVKYRFGPTGINKVDAAIARVIPGEVSTDGKILDIGLPGQPVEAAIGMGVKKSGRTTGKTTGEITAMNVSVKVQVPVECGSDNVKLVRFVDQVVVEPRGTSQFFVKAGDSGSLIVEKVRTCPGAVALLFAGTADGIAVANRIQNVLTRLRVFIVGCGTPVAGMIPQPEIRNIDPKLAAAMAVQARHEEELFRVPGTLGVGIGFTNRQTREIGLLVYTQRGTMAAASAIAIPQRIENLAVRRVVTSPFKAM